MIIQVLSTVLPVVTMIVLGMICRRYNFVSKSCIDGLKRLVVNIMLPTAVFHSLATTVFTPQMFLNVGVMFAVLCITFALGFVMRPLVDKPYNRYLPFAVSVYEGGMIGYSLYTGLVGAENLSVIAVIDIAGLLFTFSIMSNVLILIEDGKKVSVGEIIKNAFKAPAFLAVVIGITVGLSGLMNLFLATPAGAVWINVKNMLTVAMSPMILLVVGYEAKFSKKMIGPCLKTILIRAVMQAIFAVGVIILLRTIAGPNHLLEIAIIVYMSLPGSMSIQTFLKDENAGSYIASSNSLYLIVTITVYAILAGVV